MKTLNRRTMLRGCLGGASVAVGLPLLEAMLGPRSAAADDALAEPIFGVFFWANGMPWHGVHDAPEHPDLWTPPDVGPNYTASELLQPLLDNHDVSVVTGLTPKTDGGPTGLNDGHMRGFMCALTSDMVNPDGFDHPSHTLTAMRESIDQTVARSDEFYQSGVPRFRSLQLGVSTARFHDYGHWNAISYNGPDSLNIPILTPSQLFSHLFQVPGDALALQRQATVLDAVLADVHTLKAKVGAADQQRLDEHLTHLDEVQRRLVSASAPCDSPPPPNDPEDLQQKTAIMGELLAIALSCNLTRVFSMMLTSPATTHVFSNLPGIENGMHKLCHDGEWEAIRAITHYQMSVFATLLDQLQAKTDLDGNTMLERSLILGLSEYADGWGHGVQEMPALFAGGACGAMVPRVHVRETGDNNFARVHLTALRALGMQQDSYGFSNSETSSDFGQLLA